MYSEGALMTLYSEGALMTSGAFQHKETDQRSDVTVPLMWQGYHYCGVGLP